MSIGELSSEALQLLYQRKYYMLKRRCAEVEETNERLLNRIQNVKKVLKRYRKEKSQLMSYLDKMKADYKDILGPSSEIDSLSPSEAESLETEVLKAEKDRTGSSGQNSSFSSTLKQEILRQQDQLRSNEERQAYSIFCNMQKLAMKKKYKEEVGEEPNIKELHDALLEEWGVLQDDQKEKYYTLAGHQLYFEAVRSDKQDAEVSMESINKDETHLPENSANSSTFVAPATSSSTADLAESVESVTSQESGKNATKGVDFHASFVDFLKNE